MRTAFTPQKAFAEIESRAGAGNPPQKGASMKKAEMVKRLEELQVLLNMDAKDVAEEHNTKHPNWHQLSETDAYPYMVGRAQYAINYILSH